MSKAKYHQVYVGQNGSNLTVNMSEEALQRLYQALNQPGAFLLECEQANNRRTSLLLYPAAGGITVNVGGAVRIPVKQDGTPAQYQHELAGWLDPEDQPQGEVKPLHWGRLEVFQGGADPVQAQPA